MVVLCERGQLQELCEYPYINLHEEVTGWFLICCNSCYYTCYHRSMLLVKVFNQKHIDGFDFSSLLTSWNPMQGQLILQLTNTMICFMHSMSSEAITEKVLCNAPLNNKRAALLHFTRIVFSNLFCSCKFLIKFHSVLFPEALL